jgi:4-diphosphocytidyl-2-C-methyl-D-erythritol kinase
VPQDRPAPAASAPAVVRAPAKLTTHLRITGVRDDGYHLLDAEMVSLDLHDELTITPVGVAGHDIVTSLAVSGPFATGVPTGPANLVHQALQAVGRSALVQLEKRIPAGGGLGGGSADAAAVLRWAGCHDLALAARLGADVPFCLVGGRARVTGIGEILEPLPYRPATYTLCIPPLAVSTPAAYRAWDELGGPTAAGPNDLEPAALVVEPRLAAWRNQLGDATGVTPVLAGSGATWFVPGSFPELAPALAPAVVLVVRAEPGT